MSWPGQVSTNSIFLSIVLIVIYNVLNPLPNDKISDATKLKAFGDDKLDIAKVKISLFDRVEKHCGKERKCWLPTFSPFPTVFSKAFFFRVVKSRDYVIKSSSGPI